MRKNKKYISLAVAGWPLKKTLSPDIFNFFFKKTEIKGIYKKIKIEKNKFSKKYLNSLPFDGLNITTPLKEKAYILSDIKDKTAKKIKAANILLKTKKGWKAYNSDLCAFKKTLKGNFKSACVFGSGGAAASILYALGELKVPIIYCVSSNGKKTANYRILKRKLKFSKFSFMKQKNTLPSADIYINARVPKASFPDFPSNSKKAIFYDINYGKSNSFIKKAKDLKAQIKTGEEMLFMQAVKSFEIFTGIKLKEKELKKEFLRRF
ncbi:MAG: hypothetical protein GX447_02540 [Elusimicrobia bacterium]|nr:hypothetical protein [Elusimicrobiota bacterium]